MAALELVEPVHADEDELASAGANVPDDRKSGTSPAEARRRALRKAEGKARRLEQRRYDGWQLERARINLKLAEEDCAERAGVSRAFWRKCQQGQASIDPSMVRAASSELFDLWWFALGSDRQPAPLLPIDRWLQEAVRLTGGIADIAEDGQVRPDQRRDALMAIEKCRRLGDALAAALAGEGEKT
jgi:hypothetical protein